MQSIPLTEQARPNLQGLVLACFLTLLLVILTMGNNLTATLTGDWTVPYGQGPKPTAPEGHNLTGAFLAPKSPLEGQAVQPAPPDFQVPRVYTLGYGPWAMGHGRRRRRR